MNRALRKMPFNGGSFPGRAGWHHLARQEGFALNPCEVALALFEGHRAANFVKMLHHGRLAFDTKLGSLGKGLFDFGRYRVCGGEELLNFGVLIINALAQLRALRPISVVQLYDASELRVA